ncbi:MAG: nucleotidyl transferase AbiEii/AbiGii toxin family protein [Desulfosarcina sp.]|nr:nucleotidyl transferase AbiEii/AbiGii toxin family protein [Desulfosarcina sp.]
MSLSLEYLQHCSAQTGYAIGPLEKVVRLGEIAADITRHPFLGRVLALKGGTALNLCLGPPRRLSVDLDFNYIGHLERNKMLADRPRVEEAIVQLAGRKAYRIQQSADAFAGRKIYLTYRSVTGQNERIEVDLNFLFRMPVAGTVTREMWQPGELDRPTVRVVSLHEIIVGKLLAFLDRSAVRDAWDLANLPAQAEEVMASDRFRSWFIALSAILDHPLTDYTRNRIEARVTDRAVAEQLAPMLIGKALLQPGDLVEHSWASIAPLMMLADNEAKYVASIQRGELYPELLFPDDPEEAKRIAAHPAILWKLVNARAHLAKRKTKPRRRPSSRSRT